MPEKKAATRTQFALEKIREMILTGEVDAGEPLRQATLAEQLQVSRIPIREALLQLETEGLVKFEPHKGAVATPLSIDTITELFDLRAILEPELFARSIPHLTDDDLRRASSILQELDSAIALKKEITQISDLNREFHMSLYQAANWSHTFEIVHSLNLHCDRYVRMHLVLAGGIEKSGPEHAMLIHYAAKHQVDLAVLLLKQHILKAKSEVIALLA